MTTPEEPARARYELRCTNPEPHAEHATAVASNATWLCPGVAQPAEETCRAVGDLIVAGNRVGWLRCDKPAGHERPKVCACGCNANVSDPKHRAVLEWTDDPVELDAWPEAYDLGETFDVEVEPEEPAERPDEQAKAEARTTRPGARCPERLPDGARCIATIGHDFGHLSASGDRWGEPYADPTEGPTGSPRSLDDWTPPYSLFGR